MRRNLITGSRTRKFTGIKKVFVEIYQIQQKHDLSNKVPEVHTFILDYLLKCFARSNNYILKIIRNSHQRFLIKMVFLKILQN